MAETSWDVWGWLWWGILVMKDMKSQLAIFCNQASFQWWYWIKFSWTVAKEIPFRSWNNAGCCSLKTWKWTPLQKRKSTWLTECRETELLPAWNLHFYVLVSLAWEVILYVNKRELGHQLSHKPLYLHVTTPAPPARCAGTMVTKVLWEWPTNVSFNLRSGCERMPGAYTT